MIAPTFEPGSAPGAGVAAYATGMNQGQSWMERSNAMELQQQEEQLRQQQIQQNSILQPVIQAKAQADLATAANTLVSAKTLQDLRTRAAMAGPQAEQELLTASQIPDFSQQEAALGALQAKYSWMENVPEMKPLVSTIDNARAKATTMVLANKHIESAQAIADTRATGALEKETLRSDMSRQIAELNAKSKADLQQKDLEHKREVDQLTQQIEELRANTSTTVGAGHDVARTDAATITSSKPSRQEALLRAITGGNAGSPTPSTTKAIPKQVASWDEAKTLEPGTTYIGPDGRTYVRGKK
jgi:hypothetical protein